MDEILSKLDDLSTEELAQIAGQSMLALFNKLRDNGIGYQALIAGNITDSTIELRIIDNANSHDTGMQYEDIYYLSEYRG